LVDLAQVASPFVETLFREIHLFNEERDQ
jgi:hypothetical protein